MMTQFFSTMYPYRAAIGEKYRQSGRSVPLLLAVVSAALFILMSAAAWGAPAAAETPLVFVDNGAARGQIVVADVPDKIGINNRWWRLDRTRTTRYAAEFMQEYIEKVTGVRLPIVTESTADRRQPLLLVGRSSLTSFVEKDRKTLAPEGFFVRRKGNCVAIVGEIAPDTDIKEYRGADRGTLFGVFEFLERTCGVRWYFPHELGTVIPSSKALTVNKLNITSSPRFHMRIGGMYPYPGKNDALLPVTRPGNSTGFTSNHTCVEWYKYAEKQPELFAVSPDGTRDILPSGPGSNKVNHLCYSEPLTLETDLRRVKEFDEQHIPHWESYLEPSEKYVRFFPKDSENIFHCCCERCSALWTPDRENSELSEVIFGYADKFARELGRLYPGRRLAAGAYCGFLYPPTKVRLPDNVDIMLCTVKGNAKLVSPGHWKHNIELVEQWQSHLGNDPHRLFLWEYFVYPMCDAPTLYPRTMQRWVKFLDGKADGVFNNGYNPVVMPVGYRLNILNAWLNAQLLWDPDADVKALLAGFYKNLFGPAEKPMKELFELSIDRWENYGWDESLNPGNSTYVDEKTLYRNIYAPDVIARMKDMLAAARKDAPAGSVYTARVEYFAEAFEAFFSKAEMLQKVEITPPLYTVVKSTALPVIDGRLDDAVWQKAGVIRVSGWKRGESCPSETAVRIVHDGKCLYIGAKMDMSPGKLPVAVGKVRDAAEILQKDDYLAIDLDLRRSNPLELNTIYRIAVNPAGAVADGVMLVPVVDRGGHRSGWYGFWNPEGIRAASANTGQGWSVELELPASIFPGLELKAGKAIRAQIVRAGRSEPRGLFVWSPMLVEEYEYDLARMGTLRLE